MLEPMYASLFALTNIDEIEVDNQAVTDSERFEIIQTIITTMVNLQRIDLDKVTNIYMAETPNEVTDRAVTVIAQITKFIRDSKK